MPTTPTLSSEPLINLENVTKTYKVGRERQVVLHGVSLQVAKGELLAIVGPSGAGKTTLAHIVGGLTRPDSGRVVIDNTDLSKVADARRAHYRNQHIGFVFQQFSLLGHYSAAENVAVPLMVTGLSHRQQHARAKQYLGLVGLEQQAGQRADQLSGGQRQRVAIARALAMQPSIIIADEPTGNLDTARGHEIMGVLEALVRTYRMTVVMVTHDLQLAARAHRVVHIKDGRISHEERP